MNEMVTQMIDVEKYQRVDFGENLNFTAVKEHLDSLNDFSSYAPKEASRDWENDYRKKLPAIMKKHPNPRSQEVDALRRDGTFYKVIEKWDSAFSKMSLAFERYTGGKWKSPKK